MTARRSLAALLAALGLLAVPGCGGGGDKGSAGSSGQSKQDFAREANAVCRDLEREGSQLFKAKPTSANAIVKFVDQAESTIRRGVDRLSKVERPSGADGDKAKQFVDQLRSEVEGRFVPALDDLRDAAKARDRKALTKAAQKLQAVDTSRSDALARQIGANVCAG